jgi:hypothetical protein
MINLSYVDVAVVQCRLPNLVLGEGDVDRAAASTTWCSLVAPTIRADTTGLASSQANATCDIGMPRDSATW